MIMHEGLTFDDVLLIPSYNDISSRSNVDTSARLGDHHTLGLPVISANMDSVTGYNMAIAMTKAGGMGILHRFMSIEENVREYQMSVNEFGPVGVSIGVGEGGKERAIALFKAGARIFCVDVAHGHSKAVGQQIKFLRGAYGDGIFIIAGNVATYAGADYLASCGADAVKVGIGPGSVCTTRRKAGVGVPQLTAIEDCSRANAIIIADGGMRDPGDVVKAIAAGADLVMSGGFFAGVEETPGEVIEEPDYYNGEYVAKVVDHGDRRALYDGIKPGVKKFKVYRGMASKEAQDDARGGMGDWKTAEGVSIKIPSGGQSKRL